MIKRMLRIGPLAKATDPRQLLGESQLSASFERLLLDFLTISSFFPPSKDFGFRNIEVWTEGMYREGLKDTSYFLTTTRFCDSRFLCSVDN